MKKSELKALIKEVLQEELHKTNKDTLTEAPVATPAADRPEKTPNKNGAVPAGTYEDLVAEILGDPNFDGIIIDPDDVYSLAAQDYIESVVDRHLPKLSNEQRERTIAEINARIVNRKERFGNAGISRHNYDDVDRIKRDYYDQRDNGYDDEGFDF